MAASAPPAVNASQQMARLARAARCDHRDSHPVRDYPGYFEIVAGLGAVGVDRVDAQFAGAQPLALARPLQTRHARSACVRRR